MGSDGKTNPRAAAREAREHTRQEFRLEGELFDAIDRYIEHINPIRDIVIFSTILPRLEKDWYSRRQHRKRQAELEKYNKRRDGIMRLRGQPIGSPARQRWYKTGDGRPEGNGYHKTLSLGSAPLRLGAGPAPITRKRFSY